MPSSAYEIIRSEEHTSELQSHDNLVCRLIISEEHTSELQSHDNLVCRLLLEKKKRTSSVSAVDPSASAGPTTAAAPSAPLAAHVVRQGFFFFFNDPATPDIPTFPLRGPLPI